MPRCDYLKKIMLPGYLVPNGCNDIMEQCNYCSNPRSINYNMFSTRNYKVCNNCQDHVCNCDEDNNNKAYYTKLIDKFLIIKKYAQQSGITTTEIAELLDIPSAKIFELDEWYTIASSDTSDEEKIKRGMVNLVMQYNEE